MSETIGLEPSNVVSQSESENEKKYLVLDINPKNFNIFYFELKFRFMNCILLMGENVGIFNESITLRYSLLDLFTKNIKKTLSIL